MAKSNTLLLVAAAGALAWWWWKQQQGASGGAYVQPIVRSVQPINQRANVTASMLDELTAWRPPTLAH
jgi:hypothetical protein